MATYEWIGDSPTYTVTSDCTTGGTTWHDMWYNGWDNGTTSATVTQTYTLGGNGYYQPVIWRPGTGGVWQVWGGGGASGESIYEGVIPAPVLTPEQIAEQQQALENRRLAAIEAQRVYQEQEAARRAAQLTREQKAEGLVKEILGELQYTAFKKRGYIDIPSGCDPTKRYRIRPHRMIGVVKQVNGEWREVAEALCIHPRENFVEGDVVATKIALCKFDERELLQTANRHMRAA